jgi:putative redox protein
MKVTLDRINDDFLFEAKGESKVSVHIDSKLDEEVKGASPMELVLMAVGGCNAIDIIYVLKKQRQIITKYHIEVEGQRKEVEQAKPFEAIHVNIFLEGEIDHAKAKRAARLSFEKYCSVSFTLHGSVDITYDVFVNGEKV